MIRILCSAIVILLAAPALAQNRPVLPDVSIPRSLESLGTPEPTADLQNPGPDTAFAAYQTGHYYAALRAALKRIEQHPDDAAAMTLLGELYGQGLGVPIDEAKAVDWYELAAGKGDAPAATALALRKIDGRGTPKDMAGAVALFEKAAEKGDRQAEYNLGMLRLSGQGTAPDVARAFAHFQRAAQAGDPDAQYAFAIMLKDGRTAAPDPAGAAEWLAKAAAQGNTVAQIEYAIALFNGTGVAKDEVAAAELFATAAGKGNPIAQNRLARLYAAGRGIQPDPTKAMAWHLLARAAGRNDTWLDSFVGDLPDATKREAYALAGKWQGLDLLALDGSASTGQTTGQQTSNTPGPKP